MYVQKILSFSGGIRIVFQFIVYLISLITCIILSRNNLLIIIRNRVFDISTQNIEF